jgi:mannose-6-phosphate isomerase-like protein (cupin superfamily)
MDIKKINIKDKFELINEYWKPYIVGELNGQYVKLDKFKGPFTWHHHENEDEMFLVIKGEFDMQLRNETIRIKEGEFIIIPRGVEHCPSAENEVHILLFEPKSTLNTGNVKDEFTLENLLRLDE